MGQHPVCRKQSHLKLLSALLLAAVFAVSLAAASGCQAPGDRTATTATAATSPAASTQPAATSATPTPTAAESTAAPTTPTTQPAPSPTSSAAPADKNMLTGEALPPGASARERPVAVMINNIKVATPQIGLGQADLLFETQVESGITRLMAVFARASAIPELGSVRSARHDYIDLAGGLDAILVHVGASYLANDQFAAQKTNHIDLHVYSSAYWRDAAWREQRGYEHSVKTTGERLQAAISKAKYRTEVRDSQKDFFLFRPDGEFVPADGPQALAVSAPYSSYCTATFQYDPATGLYSKGQFGAPHIDLASGQALAFRNVFLLQTRISIAESVLKEVDLSAGKGFYLSGGQYQAISWRKGKTYDSFVFTDSKGQELPVNPGKSYIGIISNKQKISFTP